MEDKYCFRIEATSQPVSHFTAYSAAERQDYMKRHLSYFLSDKIK